MATEEQIQAFEKQMVSPVFREEDPDMAKTRVRLVLVASIAIAVSGLGVRLTAESTLFGLRFDHLDNRFVIGGLLVSLIYLNAHYAWLIVDSVTEWRLRLTGIFYATSVSTMGVGEMREHLSTPPYAKQLTLHAWWMLKATNILDPQKTAADIEDRLRRIDSAYLTHTTTGSEIGALSGELKELRSMLDRFGQEFALQLGVIQSAELTAALRRFDRYFYYFLWSQNLRWLLFDMVLPLLIGIGACVMLSWSAVRMLGS
jgi:hypothetical protein